jgi:hypothetical protein
LKHGLKQDLDYAAQRVVSRPSDERPDVICSLGQALFNEYRRTEVLRLFMQASIDLRPDLENELLGQFNGALNGIGGWRA